MWPYLPQNPCGCDSCESSNESTTDVGSDNVRYVGPPLDCTGIEPCDTLTIVLQKIDEVVCGILDTLNVCCTTTTSTTTLCPCTTYGYVGPRFNPGTITYVECDTLEPITDTASSTVQFACIDNNYPIIEIGSINVIDTQECCSNITTTTTTTIAINSFCYEVTAVNRCTVYWTDANGNPQSQNLTDATINICADEDSIASSCGAGGGITITGGTVVCTSDAICQPPTTTTTTTTEAPLGCISYTLETIGVGEGAWEGFACNTGITVGGIIPYPGTVDTGCITEGSLLLSTNIIVASEEPCSSIACVEFLIQALSPRGRFDAIDCSGNPISVLIESGDTILTGCIIPNTLVLTNAFIKLDLGPC